MSNKSADNIELYNVRSFNDKLYKQTYKGFMGFCKGFPWFYRRYACFYSILAAMPQNRFGTVLHPKDLLDAYWGLQKKGIITHNKKTKTYCWVKSSSKCIDGIFEYMGHPAYRGKQIGSISKSGKTTFRRGYEGLEYHFIGIEYATESGSHFVLCDAKENEIYNPDPRVKTLRIIQFRLYRLWRAA